MSMKIVTPAAVDPVSKAEAKTHLRVDFDTDDDYIESLITAATAWIENRTGRQLVSTTLRQSWDTCPTIPVNVTPLQLLGGLWIPGMEVGPLSLMREPVQSVSWVKYYDADDTQQTVSSSTYWFDGDSTPPRVVPKTQWPAIHPSRPGAFQVQFVAGYGDAGDAPEPLKLAVKWLVAHWYETREAVLSNQYAREVPMAVESVCNQFQTSWVQ